MSHVFVAYKREDGPRVVRLVLALQRKGVPVWWDQSLSGGDNWRDQIDQRLASAGCVIVVWTRASVGLEGDYVRYEAMQGKQRGILIPVLLDNVALPGEFHEIHSIDLTDWGGNLRDRALEDLVTAVKARLEGKVAPPSRAPAERLIRRLTSSTATMALLIGITVVAVDAFNVQERLCTAPVNQPQLSDLCGLAGLGRRPTREERLLWQDRKVGDCAGIREYLAKFPEGAYGEAARGLLAAHRLSTEEVWSPATRTLELFQPEVDVAVPTRQKAEAEALRRASRTAKRLCSLFAATNSFRFTSASAVPENWHCIAASGGISCGFEGRAVCELEERALRESESCGG